ncbi:MAG TPA: hypothetical protein VFH83_16050 [Spirochaetia bacterium]|nr:hypothetical protein [Spirochaetia bacterium]
MTPEEELKRLNRLIHQYETVYRTTPDLGQRGRVERQLKELRSYRDKILAVNVIESPEAEAEPAAESELADYPLLTSLIGQNLARAQDTAVKPFSPEGVEPTASQREMHNLALYVDLFEHEFIPFLTEKHLKLDFKFSMDRDAFYAGLQALIRRIADYREEQSRLAEGRVGREIEVDVRKRGSKLKRLIEVEAARLFRAVERFADELATDARGPGVKCLNNRGQVTFDSIEGNRLLQGKAVTEALTELHDLAAEAVDYLNVPDIEQENERADRH